MSDAANDEIRVDKTVTVELSIERAFALFAGLGRWRPVKTHHLADPPGEAAVLEPRVGGRWFERLADGTECEWGRVLLWDPPHRMLLTWQVGADWRFVADPNHASQVEVRFTGDVPGRTRVAFSHRHLEHYGDQAERMRAVLNRPQGAGDVLRAFALAAHIAD